MKNKKNKYKASFYNVFEENFNNLYLINTATTAVAQILENEKEAIEAILNNEPTTLISNEKYEEYMKHLINEGFMVLEEDNEIEKMENRYLKSFYNSDTLMIVLIPTMKCNCKCPYCFEEEKNICWDDHKLEILKKYAKKHFKHKSRIHLGLFGGEPLLEWKRLKIFFTYILKLKEEYGFALTVSICTNGTLLTGKMIMDQTEKFNTTHYQITIDGCKKTHDKLRITHSNQPTYDLIIGNIKKLIQQRIKIKKNKFGIGIRINLSNNTLKDAESVLNEFTKEELSCDLSHLGWV